jgi:hypothetical protein
MSTTSMANKAAFEKLIEIAKEDHKIICKVSGGLFVWNKNEVEHYVSMME